MTYRSDEVSLPQYEEVNDRVIIRKDVDKIKEVLAIHKQWNGESEVG